MFHDKEVVIDLLSEEAKKEEIREKILSALSIIVSATYDMSISTSSSSSYDNNNYYFVYLQRCQFFSFLAVDSVVQTYALLFVYSIGKVSIWTLF